MTRTTRVVSIITGGAVVLFSLYAWLVLGWAYVTWIMLLAALSLGRTSRPTAVTGRPRAPTARRSTSSPATSAASRAVAVAWRRPTTTTSSTWTASASAAARPARSRTTSPMP
ncbi:MAG: hypothetical protein R2699_06760 [Acidimicrobiales bacterium]